MQTSTPTRMVDNFRTVRQPVDDPDAAHGRIWHLFVDDFEVGSFTDLRRRKFAPGERLLDDQGHRRLIVSVFDDQELKLVVSRAL